ncbi:hypothetical protein E8F11_22840 [Pseudomonas sp. BN417]|uniref:hypothetical protein n=1 Tax=Pseudomonas sp. BN417 TaxID=2567890 RepID=UPI002454D39F|nr:hypothetical protein [Pseudomonas sp. BN417]MDH4557976.1 hypothetical protein [Pseudomonas sp. BN417]
MSKVIDFTAAQLRKAYARQDRTGEAIWCKPGSPMEELAAQDPNVRFIDGDFINQHMAQLTLGQQRFVAGIAQLRALNTFGYCTEDIWYALLEQFFKDVDAGLIEIPPAHGCAELER